MEGGSNLVTELLRRWTEGDRAALDELMPLVYNELHRLANRYLRDERRDHTLQATALVNEAYLRLIHQHDTEWHSREQFYGVAAQILRRILVDHARERNAVKRAGNRNKVSLDEALTVPVQGDVDLESLDESLERLAQFDQRKARLVELRYFAGLSIQEVAGVLGISPATVHREWAVARTWLYRDMMG
jgi:RNA polymerase sigma factor (TIGR02999 family)